MTAEQRHQGAVEGAIEPEHVYRVVSIPEETWQRLVAASAESGSTPQRDALNAIEAWLWDRS